MYQNVQWNNLPEGKNSWIPVSLMNSLLGAAVLLNDKVT